MIKPENESCWAIYAREYFSLLDNRIPKLWEELRWGNFSDEYNSDTIKKSVNLMPV